MKTNKRESNLKGKFLYKKRYRSVEGWKDYIINSLKFTLRKALSKNKWSSKYLDRYEVSSFREEKWIDLYSFTERMGMEKIEPYIYKEIFLREISFFEALEIDDLDRYKKNILAKFEDQRIVFENTKADLKKTLSEIKEQFERISWGKLFIKDYSKNHKAANDLISSISVSYIKTQESYFILRFKVNPSPKFEEIFDKIINMQDVGLKVPQYNSFSKIIKSKRFISFEKFITSIKTHNIDNLISDLNFQVQRNMLKHFKGYFQQSGKKSNFPSVEFYEVGSLIDFNNDLDLQRNFRYGFHGHYTSDSLGIDIFMDNLEKEQSKIQIVKQFRTSDTSSIKSVTARTFYIETYGLTDSFAFPCVFQGIMNNQFRVLNKIKRDVYDFVKDSKKVSIFNVFTFYQYNSRYVKLKQSLTEILYTIKRFENEFTADSIHIYTQEYELRHFANKIKNDELPLLSKLVKDFNNQIKTLSEKTHGTNEIFQTIEELNSYRTNLLLQFFSIFIAILALIFTFDKAKILIKGLIDTLIILTS